MSLAQATTTQAKKGGVWIYVVIKLQVDTLLVAPLQFLTLSVGMLFFNGRFGEKMLGLDMFEGVALGGGY